MVQKNGNINLTKKLQLTSQPIKNNNNKEHNSLVQLRATRVKVSEHFTNNNYNL